ncbi:MAG: hypothetical protein ACR2MG_20915 [Pyrinomonadaceae bacterium]
MDFYINIAFSALIGLLQQQIPNDAGSKSKWRKAFVKVVRLLGQAYPNDTEMQNALKGTK